MPPRHSFIKTACIIVVIAVVVILSGTFIMLPPTGNFEPVYVYIPKGTTLDDTSVLLEKNGLIRSRIAFKAITIISAGTRSIKAGDYYFEVPRSVVGIVSRLTMGQLGTTLVRTTIPEGYTVRQIAGVVKKNIPEFDDKTFISLAKPYEGYLFPDTYLLPSNITPESLIEVMNENFYKRISTLDAEISTSSRSLIEIVKVASLIEREVSKPEDRFIVSGIIWKRFDASMPLQVDASFFYYLDKESSNVTLDDLTTESPYNLYKNVGLPPTPISNPGLESIIAAIQPAPSKYWYYLSDKKGMTHYATTFEGHVINKERYLR